MGVFSAFAPAVQPAAQPALDPVDAVNSPAGYPAQEIYPGAIDSAEHSGSLDETTFPTTAGGPDSIVDVSGQPFAADVPRLTAGGGWQDTAWTTGHDAPQEPWDSSAGAQFAPSGAVSPLLHAEDTGGVWIKEYVVPAAIGSLTRRTQPGQTTVRNGSGDQALKDNVTAPNGRTDLDQYQYWDADGYDPWVIPYSERPILNNLAWENVPTQGGDSAYSPDGTLPDRSVWGEYGAQAYEAPPDPSVTTAAMSSSASDSGIGGGWV